MSYQPRAAFGLNTADAGMTPVRFSDFTWANQGTAVAAQAGQGVVLYQVTAGGASNRVLFRTAPATGLVTTAFIKANFGGTSAGFNQFGIGFRRSTGGTNASGLVSLAYVKNQSTTNPIWQINKWTSATAFSADYGASPQSAIPFNPNAGFYMRIGDDGANLNFSVSQDGLFFITLKSVSRTDFFSLGPDQTHFFIDAEGTDSIYMSVHSWTIA